MVDTSILGIDELVALQDQPEATVNEALRTLDAAVRSAMRGNPIANSLLRSWQEGTAFVGPSTGTYFADLFRYAFSGTGVIDINRSTDTPSAATMPFSAFVNVTTLDAAIAAGDFYDIQYRLEGFDFAEAEFGLSTARPIYLSFWVKSNVVDTFSVTFLNSASDRAYVAEYTVDADQVWEQKQISLVGDTGGTWVYDEGIGLRIDWSLGVGSSNDKAPGSWGAGALASTNQVNFMAAANNEWRMTNPRLYIGAVPATALGFPAAVREAGMELLRIYRMFQRVDSEVVGQQFGGTGQSESATVATLPLEYLPKRVAPTITLSAAADFDVTQADGTQVALTGAPTFSTVGTSRCTVDITAPAATWVTPFGDAMRLVDDGGGNAWIDLDSRLI